MDIAHGDLREKNVTDEMIVKWLWEAELEERRTHVLFDDGYCDSENVLEHEQYNSLN